MAALTFKVGGDTTGLGRAVSRAKGMLSGLGTAAKNLAIGGAVAGSVAAVGSAFRGLKLAAEMEQVSVAMEVMTGSAEKGNKAIADLMEFSNSTPLKPDEVVSAGRALIAFGTEAEDVVDVLEKIGNVSSGIGAPLGEIAEIYGKAQVSGRLFGEDINQMAGRGIPIQKELAKVLGVNVDQIKKLVSTGAVGFPELEKAFKNMSAEGGQYANMLKKQSQTFSGVFSTLTGKLDGLLRDVGVGLMNSLKPVLIQLIKYVDQGAGGAKEFGMRIQEAVMVVVEAFKTDRLGELAKESLLYAGKALVNTVIEGFTMAGVVLIEAMKGVGAMLKELFSLDNLKSLGKGVQASGMSLLNKGIDVGAFGPLNPLKYLGRDKRMEVEEDLWKGAESSLEHLGGLGGRLENRLAEVMQEARDRVREMGVAMDEADLMGAGESKSRMNGIIEDLRKSVQAIRKEAEEKAAAEKKVKIPPMEEAKAPGMMEQVMRPVVSSLGRIGGAGIRGGVTELRMSRERNLLLKTIAANTAATSARYA